MALLSVAANYSAQAKAALNILVQEQEPVNEAKNSIGPSTTETNERPFSVSVPPIVLPKGGGAIRGIGEKFSANPVTGTGSMAVPIFTSQGRSGFGPQLALSYDSGARNGPFGLGWHLSIPSVTRKTDKGLPQYDDAAESDVFILSGAEDLVPLLVRENATSDNWVLPNAPARSAFGETYRVQKYRPRVEGLFARIERWTNQKDSTDVFWRSISRDNVTTCEQWGTRHPMDQVSCLHREFFRIDSGEAKRL